MKKIFGFGIIIFIVLLSSCNLPSTPPASRPTSAAIKETSQPATPPTATPSPTAALNQVILVAPANTDAQLLGDAQKALTDLANASGLKLLTVQTLKPDEVTPGTKMVFYTSIPDNLPQVVAAAPAVQFVAVSPVDITPVPNFNVIRLRPEKRTFVAGMITSLVTPDWRVLALLPTQDPPASALEDAFRNGAQYFCGLCLPALLPAVRFPLIRHTDPANYQAALDDANKSIIYGIYLSPEVSSPDIINKLASQKFILVGSVSPPAEVHSRWAVTVREDVVTPMRTLWPDMLAGKGSKIVNSSIALTDINPDLFSLGKKDLATQAIQELDKDQLNPLTPVLK